MSDRFVRWGGIAAIIFVVVILFTAFSAGSPPATDDAIDKVRQFYSDHRGILLVSNMLALLAVPFVVWWAIVFREVARGDAVANVLGTGVLAGVLITAAAAMTGGALNVSVVYLDKGLADIPDGVLRVVFEGQGLMFGATSARTRADGADGRIGNSTDRRFAGVHDVARVHRGGRQPRGDGVDAGCEGRDDRLRWPSQLHAVLACDRHRDGRRQSHTGGCGNRLG